MSLLLSKSTISPDLEEIKDIVFDSEYFELLFENSALTSDKLNDVFLIFLSQLGKHEDPNHSSFASYYLEKPLYSIGIQVSDPIERQVRLATLID